MEDSAVFGLPHALEYDAAYDTSFDVVGNTEGRTSYYEHETGTDQVEMVLHSRYSKHTYLVILILHKTTRGWVQLIADLRGDGENIMKIRRFVPDFISQSGNTQITIVTYDRNYPNNTAASSYIRAVY